MKIVFDMDNTLADEFGRDARPGMAELLERLLADGHTLALWTSSTRARAVDILRLHDFERFFDEFVFREDYDPENQGRPKDIRRIGGDALIDDDPKQIAYMKKIGKLGIPIVAYRGGEEPDGEALAKIDAAIRKGGGLFGWLRR